MPSNQREPITRIFEFFLQVESINFSFRDVEKYLCLGADPNQLLLNGITPFHLASGCSKSFEFVRLILEHDGNPNVR